MRILLLHHELPPGVPDADAAHGLARGLAGRGVTVDLVMAGVRDGMDAELLWDGTSVTEGLLTVHRVRARRGRTLAFLGAALPLVRGLLRRERYDLVHLVPSLPAGAMLPFLDLRGAPLVITLGGPDLPAGRRALAPVARWLWRRADRVIAASEAVGRLARRTLPELRYAVIPAGVDLGRFRPRLRPGRARERVRCLAVSPLAERQRLDLLIRAVAAQERGTVELEIVGAGPLERSLRALAEDLGVTPLVTFSGAPDRGRLPQRYRDADLFALPGTDASGAAGRVGEAMASGLPVVASLAGAPESLRDGVHGLLTPPADVAGLAAAIRRLADSPKLRAELGRRGRLEAEEHLSWEAVTARHLSIYNGVQRRAPARPLLAEQPSSTW